MVVEFGHQLLETVGNTEEVRTIDFVHLNPLRNGQCLLVYLGISFVVRIDFVGNHLDLR